MEQKNLSRRVLLGRSVQLPLGGLLLLAAGSNRVAAAEQNVCVDMDNLDAGQKSIRESLAYVEEAEDQAMSCEKCGFFTPTEGGCGTCVIFNGPANARGHCESWSAKS